jgi:hypothetical protein
VFVFHTTSANLAARRCLAYSRLVDLTCSGFVGCLVVHSRQYTSFAERTSEMNE